MAKSPATPRAGFTIVELLIVIVVIAILAAITVVAYNGIQQRSRDSARMAALAAVAKAIEAQYATTGSYPDGGGGCLSSPWWNCWGYQSSNTLLAPGAVAAMPQDPGFVDNGACGNPNSYLTRAYWYAPTADRQGYVLGTYMEKPSASDSHNITTNGNYGCGNFMNWAIKRNWPF
jgi:prepilin-type N-terminal cleavage/methylation domain-containing protein